HGGSLFLDEIGDIPASIQIKLLRVLQEREFERVGGTQTIKVNVRLIAATNKDLEGLVNQGKFREDLFYRLHVFPIYVPPLRKRKSDIVLLADHFLEKYSKDSNKRVRRLSSAVIDRLMSYHWPGNVRELENCIERAVALGDGKVMDVDDLPQALRANAGAIAASNGTAPTTTDLEDLERHTIQRVFEQVEGDKTLAGKMLGISRATLYRKLKRYKIKTHEAEAGAE
ncbi:MAG: sigma 54-interacting transcriptional regulator, partial [Terriglobales bacterium]